MPAQRDLRLAQAAGFDASLFREVGCLRRSTRARAALATRQQCRSPPLTSPKPTSGRKRSRARQLALRSAGHSELGTVRVTDHTIALVGHGAVSPHVRIARERPTGLPHTVSTAPDAWLALSVEAALRRRWLQQLQHRAHLSVWIPWVAALPASDMGDLHGYAFAAALHWQQLLTVLDVLDHLQGGVRPASSIGQAIHAGDLGRSRLSVRVLAGRKPLHHTIHIGAAARNRCVSQLATV